MPARESVQLARDDLIRHVGTKPQARVFIAFLFSVPMSILFFMVGESIQWGATGAIMGIFIGIVVGFVPVGMVMAIVVHRVRVRPALLWCFSTAVFAALIGFGTLGPDYYALFGGIGLCIGAILAWIFGPRNLVYYYGRCPGCKYDLTLLPKSDVCPECGRDNRDLVEAFADVQV